ncbi:hypothetical protein ACFLEY_22155 [Bradyrhizobium sp. YCK136]|uniref:hypothetical protein n=1 Tax=Bradyrhizobium sp. YCK136 TaxID=3351346 RepID=UPI0037C61DC3
MPRDPRVDPLIAEAQRQCEGCRLAWRLDGWKHRKPMPIICTAQSIRQELRDIAAQLPWRVAKAQQQEAQP